MQPNAKRQKDGPHVNQQSVSAIILEEAAATSSFHCFGLFYFRELTKRIKGPVQLLQL